MILPRAVEGQLDSLRTLLMEMQYSEYLCTSFKQLLNYLNQRYPRIKTFKLINNSQDSTATTITTNFVFERENSKTSLHNILNLFDPNLRPKVISTVPAAQNLLPTTKAEISFKRLGTKISAINAFSQKRIDKKLPSLLATGNK